MNHHNIIIFVPKSHQYSQESYSYYQCSRCYRVFTVRQSAVEHDCSDTHPIDNKIAEEVFLTWICKCNISAKSASGELFKELIYFFHVQFVVHDRHFIAKEIQQYAMTIQQNLLLKLKNQFRY